MPKERSIKCNSELNIAVPLAIKLRGLDDEVCKVRTLQTKPFSMCMFKSNLLLSNEKIAQRLGGFSNK